MPRSKSKRSTKSAPRTTKTSQNVKAPYTVSDSDSVSYFTLDVPVSRSVTQSGLSFQEPCTGFSFELKSTKRTFTPERFQVAWDEDSGEVRFCPVTTPDAVLPSSLQGGYALTDMVPLVDQFYLGENNFESCWYILESFFGSANGRDDFNQILTDLDTCLFAPLYQSLVLIRALCDQQNCYTNYSSGVLWDQDDDLLDCVIKMETATPNADFQCVIYSLLDEDEDFDEESDLSFFVHQHLEEDILAPVKPHFDQLEQLEAQFLEQLKARGQIGASGLTEQQQAQLQRLRATYRSEHFSSQDEAIIDLYQLLRQLMSVESHNNAIWHNALEQSAHAREHGILSAPERKKVLTKIASRRKESYPNILSQIQNIVKANQEQDDDDWDYYEYEDAFEYTTQMCQRLSALPRDSEATFDPLYERQGEPIELNDQIINGPRYLENWQQGCHYLSCAMTLKLQGYPVTTISKLILTLWAKLLKHTLEQATVDWIAHHSSTDDFNQVRAGLSFERYLDTFPLFEHFINFLEGERKELNRNNVEGYILPLPQKAVQMALARERQRIMKAKR